MLFKEIIDGDCENNTRHKNIFCGQDLVSESVTAGGV
jgi:hypothetical protein